MNLFLLDVLGGNVKCSGGECRRSVPVALERAPLAASDGILHTLHVTADLQSGLPCDGWNLAAAPMQA